MHKRIIAFILTIIIAVNFISIEVLQAAEVEEESVQRRNYNYIEIMDYSNIHYTYKEDGKTYIVYESINDSFSEASTRIYILNEGVEIPVEEYTTKIEASDSKITLNKYVNGVIVERRNIDNGENYNVSLASSTYDGRVYYEGSTGRYFTGWYFAYTDNASNYVANISFSALALIIARIVGVESGSDYLAAGVYNITQKIVDAAIPIIYWTKTVYHVNQIHYPERTLYGSFVGQRVYSKLYSDSGKTNLIESKSYEWRDSIEWPSTITIGNS